MECKRFVRVTVLAYILSLLFLISSMVVANILWAPDWKSGEINGSEIIFRELKTRYISQKNVPYNCYIIGGSKAGHLNTVTFNKFTNQRFYNFFTSTGLFSNYERFSTFLIKEHKDTIKEIILHISTYETDRYNDEVYIPVEMQKNLLLKCKSYFLYFKERYLNIAELLSLFRYSKNRKTSVLTTGESNLSDSKITFNADSEKYVKQNVLINFEHDIEKLFNEPPHLRFCKKNIESLKKIKDNCENNNVNITVVIGAHFISAYGFQYGDEFDNYLRELVSVNEKIWNFCGINDVNMNPYNFQNEWHYWDFVGDKMIEIMYSPVPNTTDMDSFGILLTSDNIEEYIHTQHEKWQKLKEEYERTGTIQLQEKASPSYLGLK